MAVKVIRDQGGSHEGGDFLRVYCQHRDGSPATFATIERVFGGEISTRTWHLRTLLSNEPMDTELATRFAEAYAARKNIPVVYVEVV